MKNKYCTCPPLGENTESGTVLCSDGNGNLGFVKLCEFCEYVDSLVEQRLRGFESTGWPS